MLTQAEDNLRLWEIWWYMCSAVFQQHLKTNLGYSRPIFSRFSVFRVDWKVFIQSRGIVKNKWSCYPLINDWTRVSGSMALIFVPVIYMRRSVAVGPQIHKPIFNYSLHKAARRVKHYNWIPSPTLFLSLWWYPPESNSMTSFCPLLALSLLSSHKQGHQQISRL